MALWQGLYDMVGSDSRKDELMTAIAKVATKVQQQAERNAHEEAAVAAAASAPRTSAPPPDVAEEVLQAGGATQHQLALLKTAEVRMALRANSSCWLLMTHQRSNT